MKALELISIKDLKEAAKALGETGLLAKKLQLVGLSKQDMIKNLAYAIEHLSDEDAKKLPKITKDFYEDIFADELTPVEEKLEEKPTKSKKEKKEKSALTNLSKYGSHEGTQAFIIDTMLIEGRHTLEEMTRACATKLRRVMNHVQTLKHKKGVNIVKDEHKRYFIKETK